MENIWLSSSSSTFWPQSKAVVVKSTCLRGTFGNGGVEQIWAHPERRSRIRFLHLVVMYNSVKEAAVVYLQRVTQAKDVSEVTEGPTGRRREEEKREERGRQIMVELVKKRPIISARERG